MARKKPKINWIALRYREHWRVSGIKTFYMHACPLGQRSRWHCWTNIASPINKLMTMMIMASKTLNFFQAKYNETLPTNESQSSKSFSNRCVPIGHNSFSIFHYINQWYFSLLFWSIDWILVELFFHQYWLSSLN